MRAAVEYVSASQSAPVQAVEPALPFSELYPIVFDVQGCRLFGTLEMPRADVGRTGVLLLNSDDGCRLGPYNLWTHLARRLCAAGIPCLRFDYRGCGDSEGPEVSPPGHVGLTDAIEAEALLRQAAGTQHTVLVGICYGAEIGLLAGQCLPSVSGVVACSAGRYVTPDGYSVALAQATDYAGGYLRKLLCRSTWSKFLTGRVHLKLILEGLCQRISPAHRRRDREGAVAARTMVDPARRVPSLFIYGSGDPLTAKYLPYYQQEAQERSLDRQFIVIDGADHNFARALWSETVIEHVARFVDCIAQTRGDA